jgi:L-2-hydroxycarboxylate dehydrogenase (NAD+)
MKSSAVMPGFDEVRLPGESAWKTGQERAKNGIPIPAALIKQLEGLARELGIEPL